MRFLLYILLVGLTFGASENKGLAAERSYFQTMMQEAPLWSANTVIEQATVSSYEYYRLHVEHDAYVTFTLYDRLDGTTSLDLLMDDGSAYGKSFASVYTTAQDGDNKTTVQKIALRAGMYYVRLTGSPSTASYSVEPLISPTRLEPNDTKQLASPLSLGSAVHVTDKMQPFEDYYTFTLEETSKVTLQAERFLPTEAASQLTIDVDDAEGNRYAATITNPFVSQQVTEVLPAGTYTVHVRSNEARYNMAYRFLLEATPIVDAETFKNSIFGTDLPADTLFRGFLGRNDTYYMTLERAQKVVVTVETSSTERIEALLFTQDEQQLTDYTWTQQQGMFTLTVQLQPGRYAIKVDTSEARQQEVHYTIRYDEVAYEDVAATYRYYREIMALSTTGIIQGYPDGTFKPTQSITRRQVFTMLSRAQLSLQPVRDMKSFTDIVPFSSDYLLVQQFYEAGIIDGAGTKMNLQQPLTRAQLAKILVNTFQLTMQQPVAPFVDVTPQHASYPYVQLLASNGITTGSNGRFLPLQPVSREHFAVFLARLFAK